MSDKKLTGIDYTEELIQNEDFPEYMKGWRRFRISYRDHMGHSNVEGTVYLPPHGNTYHTLDHFIMALRRDAGL
jgi:hypothetical protein